MLDSHGLDEGFDERLAFLAVGNSAVDDDHDGLEANGREAVVVRGNSFDGNGFGLYPNGDTPISESSLQGSSCSDAFGVPPLLVGCNGLSGAVSCPP